MLDQLPDWDPSLTIGNVDIDQQHQQLMALVKQLPAKADPAFDKSVQFLLRYTFDHFTGEERWMAAQQYPQLEEHINQHRALEELFDQHFHSYLAGEIDHEGFTQFLFNWVKKHILKEDRAFADFLTQRGDGPLPAAETTHG